MKREHMTVVVPTRERSRTLYHTLRTCAAQDYDDLEILVCDNFSQDNTRDVVHSINDPRIRYINTGRRLSMVANFEFALGHVDRGIVTTIGDDDGLAFGAVARVNGIVQDTGVQAVSSDNAIYRWPDVGTPAAGLLKYGRGDKVEIRDTARSLDRTLYGTQSYHHVPIIYYGFVANDLLVRQRAKFGRLFLTNQVDIFSALSLSQWIERYAFLSAPLCVAGTSSKSNGGALLGLIKSEEEKKRWQQENDLAPQAPFQTLPSIKLLLAESYSALEKAWGAPLRVPLRADVLLAQAIVEAGEPGSPLGRQIADIAEQLGIGADVQRLVPATRLKRRVGRWLHRAEKFATSQLADGLQDVYEAARYIDQRRAEPERLRPVQQFQLGRRFVQ